MTSIFLGDSITRRWAVAHEQGWQRHFGGWRVSNYGTDGKFTDDGLHLTAAGYELWAEAMAHVLAEWLGNPAAVTDSRKWNS